MKCLFYSIVFFIIIGCSTSKTVYWCGDHPCINKKEKEAYFKKTMIVEVKELKKKALKNNSEIEKIIQQAEDEKKIRIKKEKNLTQQAKLEKKRRIKEEKTLLKQLKLEQKSRIKEEKILLKQLKLEQKRRIKEAKILTKQAKLEEKRRIKEEKILAKRIKRDEKKILKNEKKVTKKILKNEKKVTKKNVNAEDTAVPSTDFRKLVEKITNKNTFKPYPDINDVPN